MPPEEEFWSPYTGLDALCGSTLMISLDTLVKEGLLNKADLPDSIEAHLPADFFKASDCTPSLRLSALCAAALDDGLLVNEFSIAVKAIRCLNQPC